jgi:hypothetical protein
MVVPTTPQLRKKGAVSKPVKTQLQLHLLLVLHLTWTDMVVPTTPQLRKKGVVSKLVTTQPQSLYLMAQ